MQRRCSGLLASRGFRRSPSGANSSRITLLLALSFAGCTLGEDQIDLPALEGLTADSGTDGSPMFRCESESDVACEQEVHYSCRRVGEFLDRVAVDCGAMGLTCAPQQGCKTCAPGRRRCEPCAAGEFGCDRVRVQECDATGDAYEDVAVCDLGDRQTCNEGACVNACELAESQRSYVGCVFFAADLDNAVVDDNNNAARQQYAVAVANPYPVVVDVTVEVNDALPGEEPAPRALETRGVPPNFLEVFELPQREVDGSSPGGSNDGTHTALTSNAYRVLSTLPVTLYQFNPLDNVNVFSNDASLVLPTASLGTDYTVVAWPQTIGDSDNPDLDFDSTTSEEDLRSFLTIIGTAEDTDLSVELGRDVLAVVPAGPVSASGPGDRVDLTLGPFDVLNLETAGTNADFTGTLVTASRPVSVFVGSEASDVPLFGDYSTRQCCADHLEEQLFPDRALGTRFLIAPMPSRTAALNLAAPEGEALGVAEVVEPERVRVVAINGRPARVRTTLPAPDDEFALAPREGRILVVEEDFWIRSDASVAVMQALPSQGVTGIPSRLPGGDPAIIMVPPTEQYREDYIFLTPDKYAFDFVTITAPRNAEVRLDGELVLALPQCAVTELSGLTWNDGLPVSEAAVYRCQLSFPQVRGGVVPEVLPGQQNDGVHRIVADEPVGVIVYGFDSFVSYAYAGGLDLEPLL